MKCFSLVGLSSLIASLLLGGAAAHSAQAQTTPTQPEAEGVALCLTPLDKASFMHSKTTSLPCSGNGSVNITKATAGQQYPVKYGSWYQIQPKNPALYVRVNAWNEGICNINSSGSWHNDHNLNLSGNWSPAEIGEWSGTMLVQLQVKGLGIWNDWQTYQGADSHSFTIS